MIYLLVVFGLFGFGVTNLSVDEKFTTSANNSGWLFVLIYTVLLIVTLRGILT